MMITAIAGGQDFVSPSLRTLLSALNRQMIADLATGFALIDPANSKNHLVEGADLVTFADELAKRVIELEHENAHLTERIDSLETAIEAATQIADGMTTVVRGKIYELLL